MQIVDGVNGITFPKNHPEALRNAFALLISEGNLSKFAHSVSSSGRLRAKNMFAGECIFGFAKLVEDVFDFPSDVLLPTPASQLKNIVWEWNQFRKELDQISSERGHMYREDHLRVNSTVVYDLEEDMINYAALGNVSGVNPEGLEEDMPTALDWEILNEIESSDEVEMLEREEVWSYFCCF